MKIEITKDKLKVVGGTALKLGKRIVIEGAKSVVVQGAATVYDHAVHGKKGDKLTLDKVLKIDESEEVVEDKEGKIKGFFKRKKDKKSQITKEETVHIVDFNDSDVVIKETVEVEVMPKED